MTFRWFDRFHSPAVRARAGTAIVAVFLASIAPRVYAQVRIGVVDIRRAVQESAEGHAAFDALKIRYDDRQRDLDRRTKVIEGLKRRIEHPAQPIPPAQLQKMAQRYQAQVVELQQIGQQYTGELQELEAQLTKSILVKMQPLVRQIGQTDNYQIIIDEQVVHFAPSQLHLTDRVVQMYNQQYPVRGPIVLPDGGAPAPAGPAVGTADDDVEVPVPATTSADGGGDHRALPGVFFRRDAGAATH